MSGYDNAMDNNEANAILSYISLVKRVKLSFVVGIEERLASSPLTDTLLARQLLLVFSSLATKGSEEVENRVMNVLSVRVESLNIELEPETNDVELLLYALGNTGSKASVPLILSLLDANTAGDYDQVVLVAIKAMSKVTNDPEVLSRLQELLEEDPTPECVASVLESLLAGYEYFKGSQYMDLELYSEQIRSHSLLYSLEREVSICKDADLKSMMKEYLRMIRADDIMPEQDSTENLRSRRSTNDWDSSISPDYDYVESLVTREIQAKKYERHQAYITSKKLGIDDAHIKISYGYFAGTTTHCDDFKSFGRGVVVTKLLSSTKTVANFKFDLEANYDSTLVVAYARIGSNTLLDYTYNKNLSLHCSSNAWNNLARFGFRVFTLRFSLFVYVATLSLTVAVDVNFNLDAKADVCIGRSGTEVSGALGILTPTVGVTLSGGVSASLLVLNSKLTILF